MPSAPRVHRLVDNLCIRRHRSSGAARVHGAGRPARLHAPGRPIISLTAKAMKSDRDKAIAAGASDYIAKPVDVDQLVSMMRAWLDPRP